jgi:formylglycine-generating enzyme required for sulfatase activity
MGNKDGRKEEQPARTVKMSKPFAIAKYEVTQELYQAVMGKNPARWQGPRNSVEMVSWDEANEFCRKVVGLMRERKLLGDDETIRLPTEAEWEYACRAGTTTPFSFAKEADIGEYCWYKENSKGHDPPVGMKKANPWGLYDMHGYISEWCQDTWIDSYKDAPTDGSARQEKQVVSFVIRGGSYADPADGCRSAWRAGADHKTRTDTLGFRCVRARK